MTRVLDALRARAVACVAIFTVLLLSLAAPWALAGQATTTMSVSLTITAGCSVTANPVGFGSASVLSSNIDITTTVSVDCTNTTPYTVGLDQGAGSGATVATRYMTGPSSAKISYSLYQDTGYSTVWGNTAGNIVSGTGNGNAQSITVYARVPGGQTSPAPGSYSDTVNVYVNY